VFFCKYDDPSYIKFAKLEIMVRIANDKNVEQFLAELKEYALEVDMDIVKRAVKAIGQVAIKIESSCEKCVKTLMDLINTKMSLKENSNFRQNYVVQEALVVIKDIFRKYPGYESIIPDLCKCIDELDEPNARGALIWIVGEYAEKITNAADILAGFVDGFMEEFTQVGAKYQFTIAFQLTSRTDATSNTNRCCQAFSQKAKRYTSAEPCSKDLPICYRRK
jgi:AP-1 complex subunit beta-1